MRGLLSPDAGRLCIGWTLCACFHEKSPMNILLIITCLIVIAFKVLSWSSFSRPSVPDTEKKLEPN